MRKLTIRDLLATLIIRHRRDATGSHMSGPVPPVPKQH